MRCGYSAWGLYFLATGTAKNHVKVGFQWRDAGEAALGADFIATLEYYGLQEAALATDLSKILGLH